MSLPSNIKIAVIGLGYVGLPLAVEFARKYEVLGFDIDPTRIEELREGIDRTREVESGEITGANSLRFTDDVRELSSCTVFVVAVPTPVDEHKRPNFEAIRAATRTVASALKIGDVVIYESTVYPGATEELCVPLLEEITGLVCNDHFSVGYSPERINPGDREHRVANIKKVTSGSNPEAAEFIDELYRNIITAGTHVASSIRVAEAAKVIENTQRDVNIALINELAILFNRLEIDTEEVLQAAGSKWNFLPFRPGLVGGHCIGVDPYYLTHKAQSVGYHPEIILAGRRLNDSMGAYAANQLLKAMTKQGIHIRGAQVLVMGLTFKENTPDLRNSRVVDIISELKEYDIKVDVTDPWVDAGDAERQFGISMTASPQPGYYDAIILAVAHDEFRELGIRGVRRYGRNPHVFFDLKSIFPKGQSDLRL